MWFAEKEENSFFHLPDGQLIQQAQMGEERAFDALVGRYGSLLFNRILSQMRDYDTACDVLQQVLIQLYFSLSTLDPERSLRPWLMQVTQRKIIDEARRTRRAAFSVRAIPGEEEPWLSLADPSPVPEAQIELHELQRQIAEAIACLPQRYQWVMRLRYQTPLSFSEIGRLIGIPEATVKTRFQRARLLLRAALDSERMAE